MFDDLYPEDAPPLGANPPPPKQQSIVLAVNPQSKAQQAQYNFPSAGSFTTAPSPQVSLAAIDAETNPWK
eukprot:5598958-Pyramimonas_sp.AAC.1